MGGLLFNVTTAALMMLMLNGGPTLLGQGTLRGRRVPWAAVGLTSLAVAGVITQLCWSGAMDAFDSDPARSGWWRIVTSAFMQNGGLLGGAWNIATLAVIAALADWFWGTPLTLGLFLAGILLPGYVDTLFGESGHSTDPRNFAGSSGATYFLAATLSAALLLRVLRTPRTGRGSDRGTAPGAEHSTGREHLKEILLAAGVPLLGLAVWFAQSNGHGLVSVYGFALGCAVHAVGRSPHSPDGQHAVHPVRCDGA
ncbi:hypothetical protein [Streptomyces sp. ITFR-6]|uniref:hypothetical protein n=1 Tax=Streptomyces sp. ITFR-6 TaxID=3075197 RepID=UPI002889E108|nr:hypothetical protein [Streptomyces sp. ITFR-6]WNI31518.1 hypothetical protein RLT59_24025 [Streptomyces sp. ITFR-6]